MDIRKLLWGLLLIALGVGIVYGLGNRQEQGRAPDAGAEPQMPFATLAGTASCSARGCHGAIEPAGPPPAGTAVDFAEYTRWVAQDPHTRAYKVLWEPRSLTIAKNLKIGPPHEESRCLACHTNPRAAGPLPVEEARAASMREERQFGVGCEACHGPAEKWLGPHTQKEWQKFTPEKKTRYGMTPVADVVARAKACAGCHVGAAPGQEGVERDVNHDLIAAGHPRLNFELGAFMANLPPHWVPRTKGPRAADDARVWALGQVGTAEAALDLLGHRAASTTAPWPEFAEYDCYACHHDLQDPSWRQKKDHFGKRKPGSLPWGSWHFSMPRSLAAWTGEAALPGQLDALEEALAKPLPGREQVERHAKDAAKILQGLRQRLEKAKFGRDEARELLLALRAANDKAPAESWDTAEQLFLGTWALNQVVGDDKVQEALRSPGLADLLVFPRQPEHYDSPRAFHPAEFHRLFSEGVKNLR